MAVTPLNVITDVRGYGIIRGITMKSIVVKRISIENRDAIAINDHFAQKLASLSVSFLL